MRNLCAVLLAAALVTTSAFAASSVQKSPLAPGKPAGIKQAQSGSTVAAIIGGTALLGMAVALIGGSGGGGVGGVNNQPGGAAPGGVTTTTTT